MMSSRIGTNYFGKTQLLRRLLEKRFVAWPPNLVLRARHEAFKHERQRADAVYWSSSAISYYT